MLEKEILDFLNSPVPNQWIDGKGASIYLRKGSRYILDQRYTSLDLASISIEPELQRKGMFKNILKTLIHLNPNEVLFIECVNNKNLAECLYRYPDMHVLENGSLCFYLKVNTKDDS